MKRKASNYANEIRTFLLYSKLFSHTGVHTYIHAQSFAHMQQTHTDTYKRIVTNAHTQAHEHALANEHHRHAQSQPPSGAARTQQTCGTQ